MVQIGYLFFLVVLLDVNKMGIFKLMKKMIRVAECGFKW